MRFGKVLSVAVRFGRRGFSWWGVTRCRKLRSGQVWQGKGIDLSSQGGYPPH